MFILRIKKKLKKHYFNIFLIKKTYIKTDRELWIPAF